MSWFSIMAIAGGVSIVLGLGLVFGYKQKSGDDYANVIIAFYLWILAAFLEAVALIGWAVS